VQRELPVLSPAQDEAILREAGFSDIRLFYVGFTFRGWVATA
jgi:tRNA (cmo5U34)-methyltransferase